jgi:hypothetical protein
MKLLSFLAFIFLFQVAYADFNIETFAVHDVKDLTDQAARFADFNIEVRRKSTNSIPRPTSDLVAASLQNLISYFFDYSDPGAIWNQPVKDDAEIGFYSKDHENERCIHGQIDSPNGHVQIEPYFRHNDTSFGNDMEVPMQNNFEYT